MIKGLKPEVLLSFLFQAICGTDSYPTNFRAKKYKIKDKFFTKVDFQFMMRNLPVPVEEEDIDQMFDFADKDKDGKISYKWGKYYHDFKLNVECLTFSVSSRP